MTLRVGLVVPHIFMQRAILPQVIFSPGRLALELAHGLTNEHIDVTLYTPGPVDTDVKNVTADLSLFERELHGRGDSYVDLLKKHPFTFVTLARQVQSELIAEAFAAANRGELDIVHIYTNEEDIALPFASLCQVPVVFTHHDPFNFLVKYKSVMPKYKQLNWVSLSYAQRADMPADTNWVGNVYHGINEVKYTPVKNPSQDYFAYIGRIIEPKGVHLAIAAVKRYNQTVERPMKLIIAGKHYAESEKLSYWQTRIEPELDDMIQYVGFIDSDTEKNVFIGNAAALLVPSIFAEPFGMVAIEALACGTPVVALDSGALPEILRTGPVGVVAEKMYSAAGVLDEPNTVQRLAVGLSQAQQIDRAVCRVAFEQNFTLQDMAAGYADIYHTLHKRG